MYSKYMCNTKTQVYATCINNIKIVIFCRTLYVHIPLNDILVPLSDLTMTCLRGVISLAVLLQGLALSQKENELKEMREMLHQTELNNTLQQDLLKHMINDRVDIEVDNLMTNAADGSHQSFVCRLN